MNTILIYSFPAKPYKIIIFNEETKETQEEINVPSLKQLYPTVLLQLKKYNTNKIIFSGPQRFTSKLVDNLCFAEFAEYVINNL